SASATNRGRVEGSTVTRPSEQIAVTFQLSNLFAGLPGLVVPAEPSGSEDKFFPCLHVIGRPNSFLLSVNVPTLQFLAHLVVVVEGQERIGQPGMKVGEVRAAG